MESGVSRGGHRGHINGHGCHDLKTIEMVSRSQKKKRHRNKVSLKIFRKCMF